MIVRSKAWVGLRRDACAACVSLCAAMLLAQGPLLAHSPQTQQDPATPSSPAQKCGVDQAVAVAAPGVVRGVVLDPKGTGIVGATVQLTRDTQSAKQESFTQEDGQFSFAGVAPGSFRITVTAPGFTTETSSGTLASGESCILPQITMPLATNVTEVRVELSTIELAQEQIEDQEKQRLFGVIPNFYVSYVHDAAPLTSKQKFQLAWKSTIDPVSFGVTGVVAGVQQATNTFGGYGQGAAGYGRRYGAAYGDLVSNTFIGGAILPSLLKQDPRYFYKGTGTVRSRILYAVERSVTCKGDNEHWQLNYSGIAGGLVAGGISNAYYPSNDRNDAALIFENALIGIGENAAVNLLQEFVMKKFTPNLPTYDPPTP